MTVDSAHGQLGHSVRFEWGATGAAAIARGADVAIVVDVLSFTTTLSVAVERGITVFPFRWNDERAAAYAEERDAVLARGRSARDGVSLSPASVRATEGVERLVLPSPNGSTIAFGLAGSGVRVVGASLRNATAVARWLDGATVAVVAAGERWPDDTLRPAVEDLYGAGALVAALVDGGASGVSPEARVAEQAFRAVEARLAEKLRDCASGRELVEIGFAGDVEIAAELDASDAVPLLVDDAFVEAR